MQFLLNNEFYIVQMSTFYFQFSSSVPVTQWS